MIPILDVSASGRFALGSAIPTVAGAAIYEALAHNTAKIVTPPKLKPTNFPVSAPSSAANIGNVIPKINSFGPSFFISCQLLPAKYP